jgi:peptidoglycan-associated lipoprotein
LNEKTRRLWRIIGARYSPDIPPSEMPKLQQVASFMKQERKNVIVAGFTDERGTEEYNRALGERPAEAMRDALIGLGASPVRAAPRNL